MSLTIPGTVARNLGTWRKKVISVAGIVIIAFVIVCFPNKLVTMEEKKQVGQYGKTTS